MEQEERGGGKEDRLRGGEIEYWRVGGAEVGTFWGKGVREQHLTGFLRCQEQVLPACDIGTFST